MWTHWFIGAFLPVHNEAKSKRRAPKGYQQAKLDQIIRNDDVSVTVDYFAALRR